MRNLICSTGSDTPVTGPVSSAFKGGLDSDIPVVDLLVYHSSIAGSYVT